MTLNVQGEGRRELEPGDNVIDMTAPVGIEQVRTAIGQLEAAGQAVTRRAVRQVLGKGSLLKIHTLMAEIETVKEKRLDRIDLTDDDRRIILDFGARAFSLIRYRLDAVTKAREEELQKQIDAHRRRAEEVIETAEEEVLAAKAEAEAAKAAQGAAEQARVSAETEAQRQAKESERAAGQVALLMEEREEMRRRLDGTEERLTRAVAAQEAEAEEVERLEKRLEEQKGEIERLRAGREEMVSKLGEKAVEIARLQKDATMNADTAVELATKLRAEFDGHEATKTELHAAREKVAQLTAKTEADAPVIANLHASLTAERQRADQAERTLSETRGSDVVVEEIKKMLEGMKQQEATKPSDEPKPPRQRNERQPT